MQAKEVALRTVLNQGSDDRNATRPQLGSKIVKQASKA
jgi:hypothetical protein